MKAYFKFKKIYSESDKISVNGPYGNTILVFNKVDFNNNWQNLVDKDEKYELKPWDVADLSKITCEGAEVNNKVGYTDEIKSSWYDYSRNYLSLYVDFKSKYKELDFTKPIKIVNPNGDPKKFFQDWQTFVDKGHTSIYSGNTLLDLTEVILPKKRR